MAIAAPEAIADGSLLVAIAGCALMLGLLYVLKAFVQACFAPLNIKIPYVGHPFGSVVQAVENNILKWIDGSIAADEVAMAHLLSGITWLFDQTAAAMQDIANDTSAAFSYLVETKMPQIADASLHDLKTVASDAAGSVEALTHTVALDINAIGGSIAAATQTAEQYTDAKIDAVKSLILSEVASGVSAAEQSSGALIGSSIDFLSRRIDSLTGSAVSLTDAEYNAIIAKVQPLINSAVSKVGGTVGDTDEEVRSLVSAGISDAIASGHAIDSAIHTVVSAAVAALPKPVVTGAGDVTGQIADYISSALALGQPIDNDIRSVVNDAVSAAIAGVHLPPIDVGGLLQPIEDIINDIRNVSLPQVAASTAVVAATVATLEAEAGLGDPACRAKNKQICGTDPLHWASMLAGLVSIGVLLDFDSLVGICEDGFQDALDVVNSLT